MYNQVLHLLNIPLTDFQVLSEVVQPKKIFAKAMISAVSFIIVLFTLVHIAFVGQHPTFDVNAVRVLY